MRIKLFAVFCVQKHKKGVEVIKILLKSIFYNLACIVEIDKNKNVRAKKIVSGNLRFYRKNIVVTAGEMENIINRELADIDDDSVVEIIIEGSVSSEEYENKNNFFDDVLSRFVEGTYNDYALSKLISKELIESEFSETSFSAGLLSSLLNEPKEAQLAYELLKSLKEGK